MKKKCMQGQTEVPDIGLCPGIDTKTVVCNEQKCRKFLFCAG